MFAHERSLVRKYQNRPFALLGVNEDVTLQSLQHTQKEEELNWRSWWDDGGAIANRWNVDGMPTLFLIDHKGVIRWHTEGAPDSKELEKRIEQLVKEAEGEDGKHAALSRKSGSGVRGQGSEKKWRSLL